jgi:heterodisulfide reductase subunit A
VFICHCGQNIASVIDVQEVARRASALPDVYHAEASLYTCSDTNQQHIKDLIKEHRLNRLVVASCSPRTHEILFQETLRDTGLNQYLFAMANIRDQGSWVHKDEPVAATEKAVDLMAMAVARARHLRALPTGRQPVNSSALVLGGGLAGMTAALGIADQGFKVHLVEKEKELGGNLKKLHFVAEEGTDPQAILKKMVSEVESNGNITVHKGAVIESIDGYVGNFKTKLADKSEFDHGVVIIATGAQEWKPNEFLYGKDPKVKTLLEFEEALSKKEIKGDNIVFIQCVGSREGDFPNCSRVCCTSTMTNAIKAKELNPNANVMVLYRDIRTYGFREKYYQKAADKGVMFIRFDDDQKPKVEHLEGKLTVHVKDGESGDMFVFHPDHLVLASATRANPDNEKLAPMLKVPLIKEGFYLEAHMKLRPVDFATEGVFLAGTAHGPKFVDESISQALGAVARAVTILSKDKLEAEGIVAMAEEDLCDGCGICQPICEYKAIEIVAHPKFKDKKFAEINIGLCKGCGACVGACPAGALTQKGYKDNQIIAMIDAALEEEEVK